MLGGSRGKFLLRKILMRAIRKILETLNNRKIRYPLKGNIEIGKEEMEGEVFGDHHLGLMIGLIET